jgi:thiol:disulfide interchange protein DsbA
MHKSHAHLYYTLEALGREDLVAKAFETMAQRHELLAGGSEEETFKLQQQFATGNGVSAEDFAKAYNSFSVNSNLQRATETTQRYQVQGVPFFVVNGKYTTDIQQAGSEAKLVELINDLTAAEPHH